MAAGRGFIAASSRASCIRLTTHATSTTKPIPSFGSRRSLPRVRTEILRRRPRANARAAVGRPPALPDAPSAVVRSLLADRCAALPQKAEAGRGRRRVVGWQRRVSDVPTIYHRSCFLMVGTLRFAHPTISRHHCERSEAIHVSASRAMDCLAALAMTRRERARSWLS